jgi:glycine/D-amino acid oxidase-like deaminating enzyme/nitrite reductase/ring-hydroxylating ferredoxin subunit
MTTSDAGDHVPTTTAAESLWLAGRPDVRYPGPPDRHDFDVLVLGGGITGLTTALLLTRRGARVAVLEAGRIGSGVTGNNTGKVTALQSTMLSTIERTRGRDVAAAYAERSLAGVELVAALVAELGLDCDFRRRAAYTVAAEQAELRAVEKEAAAATRAGLPVETTDEVDLPFPVAGAVRLDDQVEIDPVRYAHGLATAIEAGGSRVLEGTRATAVSEGRPVRVTTTHGELNGQQVVVATHYPVWDRGLYFARMQATRAYCLAARVRGEPSRGMSITAGTPSWSFRSAGDLMVVCGQDHPAGARGVDPGRYTALEEYVRRHWDVEEIAHRWSAQDAVPYDRTPMIGTYTPVSSRMYVAAGYSKWGLSGGSMAAALLSERLSGGAADEVFSPHRFSVRGLPALARMNAKVALDLVGDRLTFGDVADGTELAPGRAGVVRSGTDRTGVFRDDAGRLHAVSIRCTHLGCLLRFNGAERSWDCPCHGSRFDVDGVVLEGPAVEPLARRDPPAPG